MVLKKLRIAEASAARGEERVDSEVFGAVVDVLITASGENFKASEIVYFSSSGSNFAVEVIVEKIVVQSAVDSEHGRQVG